MGEESAASAVAALDFVQDQHNARVLCGLAQVSHELVIRDDNSSDSLDAFDDHTGYISLGKFSLDGLYVIQRQEGDIVVRVERS